MTHSPHRPHDRPDPGISLEEIVELGRSDASVAVDLCKRRLATDPADVPTMVAAGTILTLAGRLHEAKQYLTRALTANPLDAHSLSAMGALEAACGNLAVAMKLLQQAVTINPRNANAWYHLANLLLLRGAITPAKQMLRTAVDCDPTFVPALLALGQLLVSNDQLGEAHQMLSTARRLAPEEPAITAAIATLHLRSGEQDAAFNLISPLLNGVETPPGIALCYAELAREHGHVVEAIDVLGALLERPGLTDHYVKRILFALGHLYEAIGNYSQAFNLFTRGNRTGLDSRAAHGSVMQLQILKQVFASGNPAVTATNTSELPIFIVGLPRSGTTLVEQIIACHSQVFGAGELPHLGDLLNAFPTRFGPDKVYPFAVPELDTSALDSLAGEYLQRLRTHSPDAMRITDKMPNNFLHVGLIARLFPKARIILCQRNPLDTCLSIYSHNFSTNHPYASDLGTLGHYCKASMELMDHWRTAYDIDIMTVRYEELVFRQEEVSRAMIDFCGLEWEPACLRFYDAERVVNTPSHAQVRRPIYTNSIGRWKNYETFLTPLIESLR